MGQSLNEDDSSDRQREINNINFNPLFVAS